MSIMVDLSTPFEVTGDIVAELGTPFEIESDVLSELTTPMEVEGEDPAIVDGLHLIGPARINATTG